MSSVVESKRGKVNVQNFYAELPCIIHVYYTCMMSIAESHSSILYESVILIFLEKSIVF